MSKIEIQSTKRELKRLQNLKASLELLLDDVKEENLPMPLQLSGADLEKRYTDALNEVITLICLCTNSLESHIDDLQNEE